MIEDQVVAVLIAIKIAILIVLALFPFCVIFAIVSRFVSKSRWCVAKFRWHAFNNDGCGFQFSPIPWFNVWANTRDLPVQDAAFKLANEGEPTTRTVTLSYGWLIWELQFWFNPGPDLI